MKECLILHKQEITDEECETIIEESYKVKNGKELAKRIKVVVGWKGICKSCQYHTGEKGKK